MTATTRFSPDDHQEFLQLIDELEKLRTAMLDLEGRAAERLAALPVACRASARNLLHYAALRRIDIRPLQRRLARRGLSSLGRSEAHVLDNLQTVLHLLSALTGRPLARPPADSAIRFEEGHQLLSHHTDKLLGPARETRQVRIMVTMPGEAAGDPDLVRSLLAAGMDIMRINTAHDDADAWGRMVAHLRAAEQTVGRTCKVLVDLTGPKLRTGPMTPGPQVVRCRPLRDELGREIAAARVWLFAQERPTSPPESDSDAVPIPVPGDWLARLRSGDRIAFSDARGRRRVWDVDLAEDSGALVEGMRTAYVATGTRLTHILENAGQPGQATAVGELPPCAQAITLRAGDQLILTRDLVPGAEAKLDEDGNVLQPAHIGCSLSEVFVSVKPGEPISLDDGKFLGVIRSVTPERLEVEITRVRGGSAKLRADKGINLPESDLEVAAPTPDDRANLPFIARHADLVGFSFVRRPADVVELQRCLAEVGGQNVGLMLKIETVEGFRQLPGLLLAALATGPAAVMIARGDLAVETGFERMAEVQEEILWIAEAAHAPVVWATQVLESLAREGMPSRAEITDAAMGTRAECVMLNKGPFIVEAVVALDDILHRMAAHQSKKRSMLRRLHLSEPLGSEAPGDGDHQEHQHN
jgi:pyruvate kinase